MNVGKKSSGKIIPTNRLFEKSGDGNKRKPAISPTIIDKYAVFSVKCTPQYDDNNDISPGLSFYPCHLIALKDYIVLTLRL